MKNCKSKRIITIVFIYMIFVFLIYGYYGLKKNAYVPINVSALSSNETIVFRGVSVDGKWYNPSDVIADSGNWVDNEDTLTYSSVGTDPMLLCIPLGEEYGITFSVGPDQGSVQIRSESETVQYDLWSEVNIESGLSYPLPETYTLELSETGIVILCIDILLVISMIVCMFLSYRFINKIQKNSK